MEKIDCCQKRKKTEKKNQVNVKIISMYVFAVIQSFILRVQLDIKWFYLVKLKVDSHVCYRLLLLSLFIIIMVKSEEYS